MYRMVDCATWDDPWFAELEPQGKLLFLYLLTNRRSTPAGCFEITIRAMAFETGLDQAVIEAVLPSLAPKVMWWSDEKVIWLRNFYRRQQGEKGSDKFREGARRSLAPMPEAVKRIIAAEYPELIDYPPSPPVQDTPPIPHPYPSEGASTVPVPVPVPVREPVPGRGENQEIAPDEPARASPSTPTPSKKPLPEHGPAQRLVKVWAELTGVVPANYGRAVKTASNLVKAGCDEPELRRRFAQISNDPWWVERGFSLSTVYDRLDQLRTAETMPKPRGSPANGGVNGDAVLNRFLELATEGPP